MKERIIKDTLFYSLSNFITNVFAFVKGIIVARFIGPSLYGVWNALSIILEYSRYSTLGVLNAMNREVPFYRGKGDSAKVEQIRNVGFSMACCPPFILGLALAVVSVWISGRTAAEWVMALRAVAVLVFLRHLHDFFVLLLRSDNQFKFLSRAQMLFALADLGLVAVLVAQFGFRGFLLAIVLTYLIVLGYIIFHSYQTYKLRFYVNFRLLAYLMRIGVLITAIGLVISLRTTVDRLMIAKFLGVTQLGYFGISYILTQFVFLIPSALSQTIYPRLVETYGASKNNTQALRRYVEVSTLILAYLMPVLLGEIFITLPFAVRLVLPQYIPGIAAAQITSLGLFFFAAEMMAANFLVTTNRLYWYLGCAAGAVCVNLGLDLIFLKAGFGINGVALGGIMLTSFIYTSIVLGSVAFHYLRNGLKTLFYLAKIYFPFFYSVVILCVMNYLGVHFIGQAFIFAAFCVPLIWILERQTSAVSAVYGVIKKRISA